MEKGRVLKPCEFVNLNASFLNQMLTFVKRKIRDFCYETISQIRML
jgi:hypothetical protein